MDSTNELLGEIRERMVRVETKLDTITDVQNTANGAKDIANKALDSTNSAHRRIDKIDKVLFWAGTTIIGAVLLGLMGLLISNGGM